MAAKKGKVYRPKRDEDEKAEVIYIPGEKEQQEEADRQAKSIGGMFKTMIGDKPEDMEKFEAARERAHIMGIWPNWVERKCREPKHDFLEGLQDVLEGKKQRNILALITEFGATEAGWSVSELDDIEESDVMYNILEKFMNTGDYDLDECIREHSLNEEIDAPPGYRWKEGHKAKTVLEESGMMKPLNYCFTRWVEDKVKEIARKELDSNDDDENGLDSCYLGGETPYMYYWSCDDEKLAEKLKEILDAP